MIDCNKAKSFRLTESQFNALLPTCVRPHLHRRAFPDVSEFYFIGDPDQYDDAMRRVAYI